MNISSRLLARNTILSLLGRAFPLGIAVLTMPIIIQGLGPERFGILALTWTTLAYFRLIDFGLGHATTKFVAEALGRGHDEQLSQIIWTALIAQFLLGILGSVFFILATPILIEQVFNVPVALKQEVEYTFYILSLHLPILICSISLRGVLEAAQRFDLINLVFVPASSATFLVPTVGVWLDFTLPIIVSLLLVATGGALFTYFLICWRLFPSLQQRFMIDITLLKAVVSFGGWVTLSAIFVPILLYIDRFFLAAFSTLSDVGYYIVASDILARLSILPASFIATLFPAISSLQTNKSQIEQLYVRALKYLLLIMGPIILGLIIFAEVILSLWLNPMWAEKTKMVFQILAFGILINALSQLPTSLLDGIGRPDLRTKIFLSYILFYVGLLWALINQFGMTGAALAWALRAMLEFTLFFGCVWHVLHLKISSLMNNGLPQGISIFSSIFIISLLIIHLSDKNLWFYSLTYIIGLIIFGLMAWRYILDTTDQRFLLSLMTLTKKS